jgi:hypothetical protein
MNIVNFDADMVDSSVGIFRQKSGDRRLFPKGKQELDLGVLESNKNDCHSVFG